MKKVAEFIEGTFIDYKGDEREYTICALSCPVEEGDDNCKRYRSKTTSRVLQ